MDSEFPVELYLDEVGARRARRLDPNSLLTMIRALQYFDLGRGRGGLSAALKKVRAQILLVSAALDWRYPPTEIERLHLALVQAGVRSRHVVVDHPLGHSAFVHAAPIACAALADLLALPVPPP
jgi:homoserine O-acetyltransferase